jgi:hypothetical protein
MIYPGYAEVHPANFETKLTIVVGIEDVAE